MESLVRPQAANDDSGRRLDGGQSDRLRVPPGVPVRERSVGLPDLTRVEPTQRQKVSEN